jgi:hypothetical protein
MSIHRGNRAKEGKSSQPAGKSRQDLVAGFQETSENYFPELNRG